jgi:hypothetical protein
VLTGDDADDIDGEWTHAVRLADQEATATRTTAAALAAAAATAAAVRQHHARVCKQQATNANANVCVLRPHLTHSRAVSNTFPDIAVC